MYVSESQSTGDSSLCSKWVMLCIASGHKSIARKSAKSDPIPDKRCWKGFWAVARCSLLLLLTFPSAVPNHSKVTGRAEEWCSKCVQGEGEYSHIYWYYNVMCAAECQSRQKSTGSCARRSLPDGWPMYTVVVPVSQCSPTQQWGQHAWR